MKYKGGIMKDKRNCGANMYPVYPTAQGMIPNMVNPAFTGPIEQHLPYYIYNQSN